MKLQSPFIKSVFLAITTAVNPGCSDQDAVSKTQTNDLNMSSAETTEEVTRHVLDMVEFEPKGEFLSHIVNHYQSNAPEILSSIFGAGVIDDNEVNKFAGESIIMSSDLRQDISETLVEIYKIPEIKRQIDDIFDRYGSINIIKLDGVVLPDGNPSIAGAGFGYYDSAGTYLAVPNVIYINGDVDSYGYKCYISGSETSFSLARVLVHEIDHVYDGYAEDLVAMVNNGISNDALNDFIASAENSTVRSTDNIVEAELGECSRLVYANYTPPF